MDSRLKLGNFKCLGGEKVTFFFSFFLVLGGISSSGNMQYRSGLSL